MVNPGKRSWEEDASVAPKLKEMVAAQADPVNNINSALANSRANLITVISLGPALCEYAAERLL